MIIDFHTHMFPDKIVEKAIRNLSTSSNNINRLSGLEADLRASMDRCCVDYSVSLPVATSPAQTNGINNGVKETLTDNPNDRIIRFGAIHPENEDWNEQLTSLSENGVKGIKIHPVFQGVYIDDLRFERIIGRASELGLITVSHAGYDIGFPGVDYSLPPHCIKMLKDVKPEKFVLAHTGGWGQWSEVLETICGMEVYFDISFSLTDTISPATNLPKKQLTRELFLQILGKHGADRLLFGTDSPWSGQDETIDVIASLPISNRDRNLILGDNAAKLLEISY